VTYGDAAGYDAPGELAGRKFYLDRRNAQAEDASDTNKQNDRSTLALEASKPGRKFRFTVRFAISTPPSWRRSSSRSAPTSSRLRSAARTPTATARS
jgi:hypothetical protein